MARVQTTTKAHGSATTHTTSAFAAQPTAGRFIAVGIVWINDAEETISSVTDSAGNTYTQAVGRQISAGSNQAACAIYYAKNISTTGTFTVSVVFSAAVQGAVIATEYSGRDTSTPIGVSGGAGDAGSPSATPATGSLGTPGQNNHDLFSVLSLAGLPDPGQVTAGSGYTLDAELRGAYAGYSEYASQTTATAVNAGYTIADAYFWATAAISIKEGGSTVNANLTGQEVTAEMGSIISSLSNTPVGQEITGELGSLSANTGTTTNSNLTGQEFTSELGSLLCSLGVPLTGIEMDGEIATGYAIDLTTSDLLGLEELFELGTLAQSTGASAPSLVGQEFVSELGSIITNKGLSGFIGQEIVGELGVLVANFPPPPFTPGGQTFFFRTRDY